MLISLTVVVIGLFAAFFSRLPRTLRQRYLESFRARHGVGVMLGLTVLGTTLFSMVLATILRPGHIQMEVVDAAVVAALAAAGALDFYFFSRRRA